MARHHKLEPHITDIQGLLDEEYSTQAICGYLIEKYGLDICPSALNDFVDKRNLKTTERGAYV